MCGRYTLKKPLPQIEERFEATIPSKEAQGPNFNACPGTLLPIISSEDPTHIVNAKWGLIPLWAQSEPKPSYFINATVEAILTTKSFKGPIERQRCLVLADGYYEWKTVGKLKIPYYVTLNQGELFAFAGIYETLGPQKELTFSLITQAPNPKLAYIHHRMPAILQPDQEKEWLDPRIKGQEAKDMLVQYAEEAISFHAVSNKLNKAGYNDASFIVPMEYTSIPTQGSLF